MTQKDVLFTILAQEALSQAFGDYAHNIGLLRVFAIDNTYRRRMMKNV